LNTVFNIRRLKKEVAVMRKTKGDQTLFRKRQVAEESKVAAEKIKELEKQVQQANKNREVTEDNLFANNFKKEFKTRDDIAEERAKLLRSKEELTIDYNERKESYMNELFTLDQRHNTIVDLTENVRIDRERKKAELRRIQLKLQGEREMEAKLDKQLEDILGRAVTMADLDLLYA